MKMDLHSEVLMLSGIEAGYGKERILRGLNLTVKKGEYVVIHGDNGAGKTTLFRTILALLPNVTGNIRILGRMIGNKADGVWVRSQIGYVPQSQGKGRLPISVFDAVMLGRWGKSFKYFKRPTAEDRELTMNVLEIIGLKDFSARDCRALSGGQYQRMNIARALVREPQILLLDEPTTYLDAAAREMLNQLIEEVRQKWSLTVLMISHDKNRANLPANRVVHLRQGRIIEGEEEKGMEEGLELSL